MDGNFKAYDQVTGSEQIRVNGKVHPPAMKRVKSNRELPARGTGYNDHQNVDP